ncbi:glutamine synthetase family protein [Cronobacter sakazakii]|uniref:glutamine synthetase family protein n=1 Tax=Cronobacter sakazakii TaxID=28141 RepID=UPI000CFAC912|nr:glutamine synthetase family protein [Cronobacter sakazakii]ELY4871239.1 glutamine synthetase [Cronobacter sakazakii]ELY6265974.1 glutamine synthetase [Cronobacter sakazakii]
MFSFALTPWFKTPSPTAAPSGQEPIMFSTMLNTWMLAGTPQGALMSFRQEADAYLREYPHTRHVDIYLHDLNGCRRGKRISAESLRSLAQGCYFPLSVYAMDMEGHVVENALAQREPDRLCLPVSGTLRPCASDPAHHAQLLLAMQEPDGAGCALEPRVVLERLLAQFHARGLYPVIAPEVEFYLQAVDGAPPSSRCFDIDMPERDSALLEAMETEARRQGLPLCGIVAEAQAGQFELNFQHTPRVVEMCDRVLAARRLVHQVAEKQGYRASFMAKPRAALAGSGLHIHISLNDAQGNNLFASDAGNPNVMMRRSLSGLLALMPASVALVTPGANAFRRLRKSLNEPLFSSWGYNDRSAALRLPCASPASQRIEYRLASADANPYLVAAAALAGILYGLDRPLTLPEPGASAELPALPLFWPDALARFQEAKWLQEQLGAPFSDAWLACKRQELARFESEVTDAEKRAHPH